ncbi:MAG TPA: hypothetical protein VGM41_17240 [Chitinophagaceae bacterium]|jgi:hypothetical protein
MRKLLLTLLLAGGCFFSYAQQTETSSQSSPQDYKLALGLRLSNATPTLSNSVTVKYIMPTGNALEGLISFGTRFGIGGLYEVQKPLNGTQGLKWYYGGGGYVGFQDRSTWLGPTGTIGLDYKFDKIPLNLSLDWKPELDILPKINFVPDAFGLSARFTLQ